MFRLTTALALTLAATLSALTFAQNAPATPAAPAPAAAASTKPTIYLIGDSTVNNHSNGGLGYGDPLAKLFDPAKVTLKNTAIAGRSARSFYSEGRWDGPTGIKNQLKPGDFVLMEMGTNDGPGNLTQITNSTNGRPELAGLTDETTQGPDSSRDKKIETVHTFGWYMDLYVRDTLAKGATPVMMTMIPHNAWTGDKIRRSEVNSFVKWSRQIATSENIFFIDVNQITASRLEKEGQATVTTKYFTPPGDGTHTSPVGAQLNAESVIIGVRALKDLKLNDYLTETAQKLDPAAAETIQAPDPAKKPVSPITHVATAPAPTTAPAAAPAQ